MRVDFTKGRDSDAVSIERADGTVAATRFPKKGPVPHDAIHLLVEEELGLSRAFWGRVAAGAHPEDIATPTLADPPLASIRRRLAELRAAWDGTVLGDRLRLEWDDE
ncbi:MAG: hypothetical protein MJE66_19800 [Proteobacteria bacterium]|nr:hypothetical protein [Pseudomonadota bacterium]